MTHHWNICFGFLNGMIEISILIFRILVKNIKSSYQNISNRLKILLTFIAICNISFCQGDTVSIHFRFYHSDHLGSASWITNGSGTPVQHLQYMPYGEPFVNERTSSSSYEERYTFTGKERDSETGFSYFGARYYDSDILTGWLSVDPLADKYPSLSPYNYCAWNPVRLVDPDGRDVEIVKNDENKTVTIRANFYYNKEEIGKQADVFIDGLKAALYSWFEDIRTALKDESLGAAGYSVNFEFKYIECENPEFSAKSDVDGIGNWVVNDSELPSTTSASVANSRKLRVDFSINRGYSIESNSNFYGVGQYQGTLKHEVGHFFGLYDRDPRQQILLHIYQTIL